MQIVLRATEIPKVVVMRDVLRLESRGYYGHPAISLHDACGSVIVVFEDGTNAEDVIDNLLDGKEVSHVLKCKNVHTESD